MGYYTDAAASQGAAAAIVQDTVTAAPVAGAGRDGDKDTKGSTTGKSDYYFFDSNGKKGKNKWDTFDADAECERLDAEAAKEDASAGSGAAAKTRAGDESRTSAASALYKNSEAAT